MKVLARSDGEMEGVHWDCEEGSLWTWWMM